MYMRLSILSESALSLERGNLMNDYPLLECRDCMNRDGCSLIFKIEEFVAENSFIDLSSSSCEEYTTEHTIDNGWTAYTGNVPEPVLEDEEDFGDIDIPPVEEMYEVLEEALDSMGANGFNVMGVDMNYDTMQMFLREGEQGSNLKYLESKKYGKIKVTENSTIATGYFALAVRLEIEDEHEHDGTDE